MPPDFKVKATAPQINFLSHNERFRAFVGGYGCLEAKSKILTQGGYRHIADISPGDEVVSFDVKSQKYRLSPTSGAYPKGKENLYRVITTRGEFVASGPHLVLCADNMYRQVSNLSVGQEVFSSCEDRPPTKWELGRIWSPSNDPHYWQIVLDSLVHCEDGFHRYGPLLRRVLNSDLTHAPSQADVHRHAQYSSRSSWRKDAQGNLQERIRQNQYGGHTETNHLYFQSDRLVGGEADQACSSHLERICGFCQQRLKSLSMSLPRRQAQLFFERFLDSFCSAVLDSMQSLFSFSLLADPFCVLSTEHGFCFSLQEQRFLGRSFCRQKDHVSFEPNPGLGQASLPPNIDRLNSFSISSIINIERKKNKQWFWDIHVAGDNNYLTEDGTIHHNSGKTWVGGLQICRNAWELPGFNQGYFAPTYSQIRDIFFPTIEEVALTMGLEVEIRESNKEVHLHWGRQRRSTVICRSMDRPHTIVGFKIGHALIDEIDVMTMDKATVAWRKILARMRHKDARNTVDVTTTPEGFLFTYETFVKKPSENPEMSNRYALVQASTYDNAHNLPTDYIPSLVEAYPKELIEAYLNGQFVNMKSGTVYYAFDRNQHGSTEGIKKEEPLFIGMDFNVQKMAATVYVQRSSGWHAVSEIKDVFDTPAMIRILRDRWKDKGHSIVIYPDASGGSRKSVDASVSDIALLRQAGFAVRLNPSNPAVKDRVMSVNKRFQDGKLWVNCSACPTVAACLEQQIYDNNGEPDKAGGKDHQNDATGYPIAYEFPILSRRTTTTGLKTR